MQPDNRIASLKVGLLTGLMGLAGCFNSFPPAPAAAPADVRQGEAGTGAERPNPDVQVPDGAAPVDTTVAVVLDVGWTESSPQPDLALDSAVLMDVAHFDLTLTPDVASAPDTAPAPDAAWDLPGPDISSVGVDGRADLAIPDVPVSTPDGAACPSGKRNCNGTCIDPTECCQASDCTGTCKTCLNRACVAVTNQDTIGCSGTCDSTGTCKSKKGQLCTSLPGGCAAGTTCSPEGICCDRACSGSCEACDVASALGTCTVLPSGATPHAGHTGCTGTGTCTGKCGGSVDGSCTYPATACGSASCSGLTYQAAGTCSVGACTSPTAQTCQYTCSQTAGCTGECTPTNTRCNAGTAQLCSANAAWQNISPNPCQNSGSCVTNTSGYTCSCTGGWSGANCTTMFKYLPLPTGCTQTSSDRPGRRPRISGDGTNVVGTASCAGTTLAWRWAAATGATQTLSGSSAALGVNYDGTVICGADDFYAGSAKWTWSGSTYERTQLPNQADSLSALYAVANGVSSYGTVVGSDAVDAVRWTIQGTKEKLLAGGGGVAYAISRYDEAIAGNYYDASAFRGFRKPATGSLVNLDCASAGDAPGVYGISTDGKVVVGVCGADAVRWDASGNRSSLGFQGLAYAANQDGTVIVGGPLGPGSISQVFVWTTAQGARNLGTVLAGVPGLPSGADLVQIGGVSSDGRIIVGSNNPASGTGEKAWIAYLPP